jgi:hypothetical protein
MSNQKQNAKDWLWIIAILSEMMVELSTDEPDHEYIMQRYDKLHQYTTNWQNLNSGNGVAGSTTLRASDGRGLSIHIEIATEDKGKVELSDVWNNLDI